MHNQRNEKKKKMLGFLRLNAVTCRCQNVPVFKKKGPFQILLGGHLGVIFQTPLFHRTCFKKKCATQKGKSLLGCFLKTSGHECVQPCI